MALEQQNIRDLNTENPQKILAKLQPSLIFLMTNMSLGLIHYFEISVENDNKIAPVR